MDNCRECKRNFPCISCAENILFGREGPGFEFGRRIIYPAVSQSIYEKMKVWMEKNPKEEVINLKDQK